MSSPPINPNIEETAGSSGAKARAAPEILELAAKTLLG
jgi:hypothetical protein